MPIRPYQQDAINAIYNFYKKGGLHCILQAPTASGKTYIFSQISKMVSDKGNKVLILTDRVEILTQAGGSLKKIGLNSMFIQSGAKYISNSFNCYVGMSQTLRKRVNLPYWIEFFKSINLLVIDECHEQQFNWIFESGLFDKKHALGVTATPERSGDMRQLGLDYEEIIELISIEELIKQGYLVNNDYYGFSPPNLTGVQLDSKTGDYKTGSLFNKFNSPKTYGGAVKNYQEICPNTKAIFFCVNIEHCIRTAIAFDNAGISAKFIVSKKSKPKIPNLQDSGKMTRYDEHKRVYDLYQENLHLTDDRKKLFKDFKENKFLILINAGIAVKGYDEPSIETVGHLYATLSITKLMQARGRGGRICPEIKKTHFNELDFGGNAERLGHYSEKRLWSLWHDKYDGEGLPPIKTCGTDANGKPISNIKGCNRPILASYKICPFCGFKYPEKEIKEVVLELTMPESFESTKAIKTKRIKDMTNIELHDYWKLKGHKSPWLWRQLWYRGGNKSIESFGKKFGWKNSTIDSAINFMCDN